MVQILSNYLHFCMHIYKRERERERRDICGDDKHDADNLILVNILVIVSLIICKSCLTFMSIARAILIETHFFQ